MKPSWVPTASFCDALVVNFRANWNCFRRLRNYKKRFILNMKLELEYYSFHHPYSYFSCLRSSLKGLYMLVIEDITLLY